MNIVKKPRNKPLFTDSISDEIVKIILSMKDDPRLKWYDDKTKVKVNLKRSVQKPGDLFLSKETINGRSRRLRISLIDKLTKKGWSRIGDIGVIFKKNKTE